MHYFTFILELEDEDTIELRQEQLEKDKYLGQSVNDSHDNVNHNTQENDFGSKKRTKRQSDYEYTPTKTRCPLLLVADYRFFQEMGASNTKTTISYLVSSVKL